MTSAWLAFWNGSHPIYVNARHKDVHYRLIAKAIAALVPRADARVLDYGCGEALHADVVAAAAGEVLLCEAAPRVRAGIAARFADNPKIRAIAPEEVERLAEHSLDLVVLHSVAQYLKPEETARLLALFHRLLKSDGLLVVSDVLSPHVGAATDAAALLRFGAANGFFVAAVTGLMRTLLSGYWRLRARLGLTRYGEAAMLEKLAAAGFSAQRAAKNIGHNQARTAYYARAKPAASRSRH
jgi:SAM-dependent methyltransferase